MHVSFRRAERSDVPLLARMNKEMITAEQSRNPLTLDQLEVRFEEWLAKGWMVLIIYEDETIVGYTVFSLRADEYDPDQPEAFVRHFMLRPPARGRGLGRQAFDRLAEEWFPEGATVVLGVLESNPGGRRFWEALGFRPYATTLRREA